MNHVRIIDIEPKEYKRIRDMFGRAGCIDPFEIESIIVNDISVRIRYAKDDDGCVRVDLELTRCDPYGNETLLEKDTVKPDAFACDFTLEHDGSGYSLILQKAKTRPESIETI